MDLKELQDLLKKEKAKIIIVENGEPLMVILPYEEYKKQNNRLNESSESTVPLSGESEDSDELTVDDLPL